MPACAPAGAIHSHTVRPCSVVVGTYSYCSYICTGSYSLLPGMIWQSESSTMNEPFEHAATYFL